LAESPEVAVFSGYEGCSLTDPLAARTDKEVDSLAASTAGSELFHAKLFGANC